MTAITTKQQFLRRIQRLPGGTLWAFGVRQAWAAIFGGLLLMAIIVTKLVDLPLLSRYDWLFVYAIAVQVLLIVTRLEKPHEVLTIFLFHVVGLGMELFKTSSHIAAWSYPGDAVFHLGQVPLFAGFMYAAVGSYIARAWRVMDLSFVHYPRRRYTVVLALAIYGNFFSHHYVYDIRFILFAAVILLFGRTIVSYRIATRLRRMPLIIGFGLIAAVIWLAENVATYTGVWLYPNQLQHWRPVSPEKIGSWFLLMIISFIMIDTLYYIRLGKRRRELVS